MIFSVSSFPRSKRSDQIRSCFSMAAQDISVSSNRLVSLRLVRSVVDATMTVSSGITWRWRVALRRKAFSFFFSKDSCQKALGTKMTSSSVSFDSSCYWLSLVTLYGSGCTLACSVGNQFAECIIIARIDPDYISPAKAQISYMPLSPWSSSTRSSSTSPAPSSSREVIRTILSFYRRFNIFERIQLFGLISLRALRRSASAIWACEKKKAMCSVLNHYLPRKLDTDMQNDMNSCETNTTLLCVITQMNPDHCSW